METLKDTWKEIIETANNQDPHYSFELFEGTLENIKKELINKFMKMIDEELEWRNCPADNKGGSLNYEQKYKTLIKFKQQLTICKF